MRQKREIMYIEDSRSVADSDSHQNVKLCGIIEC